jgi:hypothetical protein
MEAVSVRERRCEKSVLVRFAGTPRTPRNDGISEEPLFERLDRRTTGEHEEERTEAGVSS